MFIVIAATAGVGGGNFASSMANINFFYPTRLKGTALGLNAAGGNFGVSVIQFFLPIIVGGAGAFGLVKASQSGDRARSGPATSTPRLAVVAAITAYFFMNNLSAAYSKPREQLAVVKYKHTWIMSFLYIGTFGSFIGYSAAMPLLIKINFFRSPIPTESIGINFAYYAFLGALVGSLTRPFGGWLADKYGGAQGHVRDVRRDDRRHADGVLHADAAQDSSCRLRRRSSRPGPRIRRRSPASRPEIVSAVNHNSDIFPLFLVAFLFVFAATGIGNGSTYRMIPLIWKSYAQNATADGTPERARRREEVHQGGLGASSASPARSVPSAAS